MMVFETLSPLSPKHLIRLMSRLLRSNLPMDRKRADRKEEEIPAIRDRAQETSQTSRHARREPTDRTRSEKPRGGEGKAVRKRDRARRPTGMATLHLGAGRTAGIRAGDLVGAIANETGLNSTMIGPIKIADHFSLVDVPEELAQGIMKAIGRTRIKGKKVTVRIHHD